MIKWICKLDNGDSDGTITFYNSNDTSASAKDRILSGVIKKEVNETDSFTFEIHKSSSYYSRFTVIKTLILCYGVDTEQDNKIVGHFLGRVKEISLGMYGVVKITCEGVRAFLDNTKDNMRRRHGISETGLYEEQSGEQWTYADGYTLIWALFHTSGFDEGKGIAVQHNENLTNRIYFYNVDAYSVSGWEESDLDTTMAQYSIVCPDDYDDVIYRNYEQDTTLLDSLNCYHNEHGGNIVFEAIDKTDILSRIRMIWVPEYKTPPTALQESQKLNFGENILSVKKDIISDNIFTRLYPYGADGYWTLNTYGDTQIWEEFPMDDVDYDNDYSPWPLPYISGTTVESLLGDYIDVSEEAIAKYGIIEKCVVFDTAKTNAKLEKKAKRYIKENFKESYTIDVTALDLATIGAIDDEGNPYQRWRVGRYVHITSSYHELSGWFMVASYEQDIFDPTKSRITFTNSKATLSKKLKNTATKTKQSINNKKIQANNREADLYRRKVSSEDVTKVKFVSELPETPDENTLYLIPEE